MNFARSVLMVVTAAVARMRILSLLVRNVRRPLRRHNTAHYAATPNKSAPGERGFTLMELILVIVIIALATGLLATRLGVIDVWREQAALRKLAETIVLLNHRAVMDREFYRMEFDFEQNSYRVGVMKIDPLSSTASAIASSGGTALEIERDRWRSPSLMGSSYLMPPTDIPALAEPVKLPGQLRLLDVRSPRGKVSAGDGRELPFLDFFPYGFSDFGLIHISNGPNNAVTIFSNPWTGVAKRYDEYKDFKWALGNRDIN